MKPEFPKRTKRRLMDKSFLDFLRGRKKDRESTGCKDKEKLGRNQARQKARAMTLRFKETIQAYECEFCGHWHVGHK